MSADIVKKIPTTRIVVACALIKPGDDILLQQCPSGHRYAGLWEFPGGKLEDGETPEQGLCRELWEELGVEVLPESVVPFAFASDPEPDLVKRSPYVILLYTCREWRGEPRGREGQAIDWHALADLPQLAMPPLDIPLAKGLSKLR